MTVALRLLGEAHRIEPFRIGPDLRHVVGEQRIDAEHGAGGDRIAHEGEIPDGAARDRGNRRFQPQRLLERHLGELHRLEMIERRGGVGRDAQSIGLVAQAALPIRIGGQRRHERCQRGRQRVVRGHHQKTHVVDDVLRRKQGAVLVGGLAQLREQILAAASGAADRYLFREIGDDTLAAPDAARHLGAGQRRADHRDRGGHHVDEGVGDIVDLRPEIGAEERGRREIERELLDRRIQQHRTRLRLPLPDPRGDPGIESRQIGFHRPGFERHRQRPAMQAVLVEVEQHQAARKQQIQNPAPAERRGEQLGLIEQHQLVGLRSEEGEAGFAEDVAAIEQAVFGGRALHLPLGIGEHVERLADEGPALVAGNMRQRIALRRCQGDRGRSHTLHRHGSCSVWSGMTAT